MSRAGVRQGLPVEQRLLQGNRKPLAVKVLRDRRSELAEGVARVVCEIGVGIDLREQLPFCLTLPCPPDIQAFLGDAQRRVESDGRVEKVLERFSQDQLARSAHAFSGMAICGPSEMSPATNVAKNGRVFRRLASA